MAAESIRIDGLSKFYRLYDSPRDRLKEALRPGNKKYHREFYALRNIDLNVDRGEILGIVGRNGSGKSTLLKLIAGVLTPSAGTVRVDGKISALLELGSGFNPEFSGLQNIYFYGTILGLSRAEMDRKLDAIVDFAELGEFIHQPLKVYSSGMKARLGFAVAVHIDPEILILDEVLSVGDALFRRKCYAKMEQFFKGGNTILYVSHDLQSVIQFCNRVVVLNDGKVVMDGDPKSATAYYQKLLFSNNAPGTSTDSAGGSGPGAVEPARKKNRAVYTRHETHYLPDLQSKTATVQKNADVAINNARIVDQDNRIVNLLEYRNTYRFLVDVEFGVDAACVAFGFELKTLKGVNLVTVESSKLYERGHYFTVKPGDAFHLEYEFPCLLGSGLYYLNFGVSSYDGEQVILNRILDILVFKVVNQKPFSSAYFEIVDRLEIDSGDARVEIKLY